MLLKTISTILVVCAMGILSAFAVQAAPDSESKAVLKSVRVVLIGASIGEAWKLAELPSRTHSVGYEFEALQAWQFDKSDVLDEVLMRPTRKFKLTRTYFTGFFKSSPRHADVIVMKECSAYFPRDMHLKDKQQLIDRWVRQISGKNIRPMLATSVPVTRARATQEPGKQHGLLAFNDWIREYARKNGVVLLDLETATRTDSQHRYLRDDLATDDGSHLNRKAYDLLDKRMLEAICTVKPTQGCP
jgi:hypothetical protein